MPSLVAFWFVVLGVCGPIVGFGTVKLLTLGRVHVREFVAHVRKLLSVGNRQRAIRLSQADPDYPLLRLAHYALTLRLPPEVSEAPPGSNGYRAASLGQPFEARARETLELRAAVESAPADRWWRLVMVAATPVVLASAATLAVERTRWLWIVAGIVAVSVAAAYATVLRSAIHRDLAILVECLAPYVLREGDEEEM